MDGVGDANRGSRRSSVDGEKAESVNLRDLLRVKDDDGSNDRCRVTLSDVLSSDKRLPVQSNRTLFDIIRNDAVEDYDDRNSWKQLREKLQLHRAGAGATYFSSVEVPPSSVPIRQSCIRPTLWHFHSIESGATSAPSESAQPETPISFQPNRIGDTLGELDPSPNNELNSRNQMNTVEITPSESSEPNQLASQSAIPESADRNQHSSEQSTIIPELPDQNDQPARMSLMALLAETDGSIYVTDEDEVCDADDDNDSGGGGGNDGKKKEAGRVYDYNSCCVCMVRHKGAAFIPCGHTFCRLCCRELWVQRGNCPLCNGFIVEVLDIF